MISKEEVHNLAALARLDLSEAEVASLQEDISNILEYVGQVSAAPLEAGAAEALLVRNVLRVDILREVGSTMAGKEQSVIASFPEREGAYNVVRKIIQKDE